MTRVWFINGASSGVDVIDWDDAADDSLVEE